jgi:hypothetical protein
VRQNLLHLGILLCTGWCRTFCSDLFFFSSRNKAVTAVFPVSWRFLGADFVTLLCSNSPMALQPVHANLLCLAFATNHVNTSSPHLKHSQIHHQRVQCMHTTPRIATTHTRKHQVSLSYWLLKPFHSHGPPNIHLSVPVYRHKYASFQ